MDDIKNPVIVLDDAESWQLLGTHTVGRLVTHVGDVVDIFPVNYVVDGESIVLRTAEGTKLTEMLIGGEVLFEVDEHTATEAWSVVLRGRARRLETEAEILAADALPLRPLVPTLKRNYVRIEVSSLSGRKFELGGASALRGAALLRVSGSDRIGVRTVWCAAPQSSGAGAATRPSCLRPGDPCHAASSCGPRPRSSRARSARPAHPRR